MFLKLAKRIIQNTVHNHLRGGFLMDYAIFTVRFIGISNEVLKIFDSSSAQRSDEGFYCKLKVVTKLKNPDPLSDHSR